MLLLTGSPILSYPLIYTLPSFTFLLHPYPGALFSSLHLQHYFEYYALCRLGVLDFQCEQIFSAIKKVLAYLDYPLCVLPNFTLLIPRGPGSLEPWASMEFHVLTHPLKWTIQKSLVMSPIKIQWAFLNAHFPWTFWSFGPCQLLPSIWKFCPLVLMTRQVQGFFMISVITICLSNLSSLLLSSKFALRVSSISLSSQRWC